MRTEAEIRDRIRELEDKARRYALQGRIQEADDMTADADALRWALGLEK